MLFKYTITMQYILNKKPGNKSNIIFICQQIFIKNL